MTDEEQLSFILLHQVSVLSVFIAGENVLGRVSGAWIVALWSPA